ncbi:MAG: 3-dehydroquinate synthase [Ignavibacteriales bacterium]|nr:MAG: 3-dehydroquinate synthase [Ignavibacteriales bacterium]
MKKFELNTESSSSEIFCGTGAFEKLPQILKELHNQKLFIVIDKNVFKYYQRKIEKVFRGISRQVFYYHLKPGERSKSVSEFNKLLIFFKKNECSRNSTLISIGGGVTGDISGFTASVYMRGINLIHIPTTLLSMVDSSIGGKTAINLDGVKNLAGSIYQPEKVIIDPTFLKTLPQKEILSGTGEILKYGLLINKDFFLLLKKRITSLIKNDRTGIEDIILQCARYKASVVQIDENDSGMRKILNLGHTFGHAIESELNYKLTHGECLAFGLKCMLCLSFESGLINQKNFYEYFSLLNLLRTNKKILSLDGKKLISKMIFDKKRNGVNPTFILMKRIGEIIIDYNCDSKRIAASFNKAKQLTAVK